MAVNGVSARCSSNICASKGFKQQSRQATSFFNYNPIHTYWNPPAYSSPRRPPEAVTTNVAEPVSALHIQLGVHSAGRVARLAAINSQNSRRTCWFRVFIFADKFPG
ncbi:hypothetical protein BDY21DRAFT_354245 [Lineolata rhizophorae]|uniref:Uncharacterized protein n=1 Tax=Lineolata rhizophorae TaxID=578093 RepID=A0A6A6NRW3_9PEZI|nr:hypothetical protein BDY21DRAFT_354245 [Lineolata rhizophorae]